MLQQGNFQFKDIKKEGWCKLSKTKKKVTQTYKLRKVSMYNFFLK